jgi:hypothetical protein
MSDNGDSSASRTYLSSALGKDLRWSSWDAFEGIILVVNCEWPWSRLDLLSITSHIKVAAVWTATER